MADTRFRFYLDPATTLTEDLPTAIEPEPLEPGTGVAHGQVRALTPRRGCEHEGRPAARCLNEHLVLRLVPRVQLVAADEGKRARPRWKVGRRLPYWLRPIRQRCQVFSLVTSKSPTW